MTSLAQALESGVQHHRAGELEQAERIYQQILELAPQQADPLHLLGVIAHQQGRYNEAISLIEQALELNPEATEYQVNLGAAYRAVGKLAEAANCLQQSLRLAPGSVPALTNLGNVYIETGEYQAAVDCYQRAVQTDPTHLNAVLNLGIALRLSGFIHEAILKFQHVLTVQPTSAEALLNLGIAMTQLGKLDTAAACYRQCLKLSPRLDDAAANLAALRAQQGDFSQAWRLVREVLEHNPHHGTSYAVLSQLHSSAFTEADAKQLEVSLDRNRVPHSQQSAAHFSLGRYYERDEDYGQAWSHFELANQRRHARFDPAVHRKFVGDLIETFQANVFRQSNDSSDSTRPVFVVGMPRTGTSLVEQIVSSHPDAYGCGELDEMERISKSISQAHPSSKYPQACLHLSDEQLAQYASRYLGRVNMLNDASRRAVDKLPDNFLHLGLIAMLFPQAKVIHCRRHPLDTCLSCYTQNFQFVSYSCDLQHLAMYFAEYRRLMRHWREVLPLDILDVDYESVVRCPEVEIRRLIDFCGLAWDDRCLAFHETSREVRTPSCWQVRQPIYHRSIGRWKQYSERLQPLVATLRRLGVAVDDD